MLMVILKSLYMLFTFYSCGVLYRRLVGEDNYGNIAVGVILSVASVQIIILPLYLFGVDVNISCFFFSICTVIICIYGLFDLYIRRRLLISKLKIIVNNSKWQNILYLLSFMLVISEIYFYLFYYIPNSDDAFYVANINTSIETNKWFLIEPSTGNPDSPFYFDNYVASGYEAWMVFFSKLFRVNGAVLSHTICPIAFVIVHYTVVFSLAERISYKYKAELSLLYVLMDVFSRYSNYQIGSFLIVRIWQGKAVMANILFPLMLIKFIDIYRKKQLRKNDIIFLTICLLAGIGFNPTGIYLTTILYGAYSLSFIIMNLLLYKSKDFADYIGKQIIYLIIPLLIALPVILLRLYFMLSNGLLSEVTQDSDEIVYQTIVKNTVGDGYIIVILWIISIIICALSAPLEIKFLISFYTLFIIITFLNPFLSPIISKYVSSTATYWRLFWLLQPQCVILFGITQIFLCVENDTYRFIKNLIVIGLCLMIIIGGENTFSRGGFRRKNNMEAINSFTVSSIDAISHDEYYLKMNSVGKHPRVLTTRTLCHQVRQYDCSLEVVWTKYLQHLSSEDDGIKQFMDDIYKNGDYSNLMHGMEIYDIDYIVLKNDADINDYSNQLLLIYKNEKYGVYRAL